MLVIRIEYVTSEQATEPRPGPTGLMLSFFFFQAEDGIRDGTVTGVQTCALPICESLGDEQHLDVVQKLAHLLGGPLRRLVLGRHPRLGGLLENLLADEVDAPVELRHGARPRRPGSRLLRQLGPQRLERLHASPFSSSPFSSSPFSSSPFSRARSATAVATAAVAASYPLSSVDPGSPLRAYACSSSS